MGYDGIVSNRKRRTIKSSAHIAKLLDGEGYTEEIVARVERWQRQQVKSLVRRQKDLELARSAAGRVFSRLSERDRKAVGRFIALKDRMSFEAGLKVGLTTAFYGDDGE